MRGAVPRTYTITAVTYTAARPGGAPTAVVRGVGRAARTGSGAPGHSRHQAVPHHTPALARLRAVEIGVIYMNKRNLLVRLNRELLYQPSIRTRAS